MNRSSNPLTFITAWIVSDKTFCAKQMILQCQLQRSLITLETARFSSAGTGTSSSLGRTTQNGMLATGCSTTIDPFHTAWSATHSVPRTLLTTRFRLPISRNTATRILGNCDQGKQIIRSKDSRSVGNRYVCNCIREAH